MFSYKFKCAKLNNLACEREFFPVYKSLLNFRQMIIYTKINGLTDSRNNIFKKESPQQIH